MKRRVLGGAPDLSHLHAENRRLLCYQAQTVKWGRQLRIKTSEVVESDLELYIVLLQGDQVLEIRSASRQTWDTLRPVDQFYRICVLDHLPRVVNSLTLSSHQLLQQSSEIAKQVDEPPAPVLASPVPSLPLLWPHQRRRDVPPVSESATTFYCSALCDFVLLRRPLAQSATPRLTQKWLTWLESHFQQWPYDVLAFHVARALCHSAPPTPLVYGTLQWPLAREWLDFTSFIFAQQRMDVDAFEQQLRGHAAWISQWSYGGFHHRWQDFVVDDCRFWHQEEQQVEVSALWLLHCDKLQPHRRSHCGRIWLERRLFLQELLPVMYRLALSDTLHLLRCTALQGPGTDPFTAGELGGGDHPHCGGLMQLLMRAPEPKQTDWSPLLRFNREQAQTHSSPVMRALLRHEQREEERRTASRDDPQRICEAVDDIEDLAQRVPPCMARLMQPQRQWLKNWDRFRLVGWLYDAGYSQEQVIGYVCRDGADSGDQRATIASLYQSCINVPPDKRRGTQGRVSAGCGRLINDVYETGNVLRCPFEEAKNGDARRKDHTPLEKSVFQAQCAGRGNLSCSVYHPLDYVQARCGVKK